MSVETTLLETEKTKPSLKDAFRLLSKASDSELLDLLEFDKRSETWYIIDSHPKHCKHFSSKEAALVVLRQFQANIWDMQAKLSELVEKEE